MRVSVYAELRAVPVLTAAAALGLSVGRDGCGPCPCCGAEQRGRSDRRVPVGITGDGRAWRCHRCDARGDTAALVAAVAVGSVSPSGDAAAATVRARAAEAGLVEPDSPVTGRASSVAPVTRPVPSAAPVAPPRRTFAPASEVARVWDAAQRITAESTAGRWLRSRALDPEAVAVLDLARELPIRARLPSWAAIGDRVWTDGWRVVLPMTGPEGDLVGLRARWCDTGDPPAKELGGRGVAAGPAVYADPVGRWLLTRGPGARAGELAGELATNPLRWRWSGVVVIAEGAPDWLTLATAEARQENDKQTAAILSLWSGGWTGEIAARLPAGCVVRLATHDDDAGHGYAERVRASLPAGVRVEVRR